MHQALETNERLQTTIKPEGRAAKPRGKHRFQNYDTRLLGGIKHAIDNIADHPWRTLGIVGFGVASVGTAACAEAITVPTDPTVVIHTGGGETTPVPSSDIKFTDANAQLFLKASLDYQDMDISQKAILSSYWNEALGNMKDITTIIHSNNILAYKEDGTKRDSRLDGVISKSQIKPMIMGKIIQFEGADGKIYDLGMSHPYQSDPSKTDQYGNPIVDSVDYTSLNQHMIPGFYGGYVKVGNQYVFAELFPNATKITKAQADIFKQNGTVEVEGNDKVGYYKVDGYKVNLFQVDGKHDIALNGSIDQGGHTGAIVTNGTPDDVINGNASTNYFSELKMGNSRIGQLILVIYGGSGDANTQLLNYARTGNNEPSFILDKSTQLTTATDASGQTVYNVDIPQSVLNNLPYTEGFIVK